MFEELSSAYAKSSSNAMKHSPKSRISWASATAGPTRLAPADLDRPIRVRSRRTSREKAGAPFKGPLRWCDATGSLPSSPGLCDRLIVQLRGLLLDRIGGVLQPPPALWVPLGILGRRFIVLRRKP